VEGINNKRTTKEKTGCQQDDGEQNGVTWVNMQSTPTGDIEPMELDDDDDDDDDDDADACTTKSFV